MRDEYKPNELIIDRAVRVWKEILAAPKYRNTRPGEEVGINSLACGLAGRLNKNNTPDILEAFAAHLKTALMTPLPGGYYENCLRVDYDPCKTLDAAAKAAGLVMAFPYKTGMYIVEDYFSFAYGCGEPLLYYYPLANGKWLVTHLQGKDMSKIVDAVNVGLDLGLTVID